jgi:hypothetical protein
VGLAGIRGFHHNSDARALAEVKMTLIAFTVRWLERREGTFSPYQTATVADLWDRNRVAIQGSATATPMFGDMVNYAQVDKSSAAPEVITPDEVRSFSEHLGLELYLARCLSLVVTHFKVAGPIRLAVQADPDFPDEWIEVDITADGEADAVSAAYKCYTIQWLTVAPPHLCSRVRLSLGLL